MCVCMLVVWCARQGMCVCLSVPPRMYVGGGGNVVRTRGLLFVHGRIPLCVHVCDACVPDEPVARYYGFKKESRTAHQQLPDAIVLLFPSPT